MPCPRDDFHQTATYPTDCVDCVYGLNDISVGLLSTPVVSKLAPLKSNDHGTTNKGGNVVRSIGIGSSSPVVQAEKLDQRQPARYCLLRAERNGPLFHASPWVTSVKPGMFS